MNSGLAGEAPAAPAAGAEAHSGERKNISHIKLVRGRYFPVGWRNPSVGTPWVAELVGLDPHYGFARKFIRAVVKERRDATYLIDAADLRVGAFYEERVPWSWRHPDIRNYYRVLDIDLTKGEVTIEYLERKEIIFILRERDLGGAGAPWGERSGGHVV